MSPRIRSRWSRTALLDAGKFAAVAVAVLMTAAPRAALSAAEGPFSALHGNWSGGGTIKKADGGSERIRCRSSYDPSGAASLQLRLRCASDSYNFDLSAKVNYEGGAISGTWSEASRGVTGNIQGHSNNNGRQVTAVAQAAAFSANLTLTTRDARQSVLILSPGSPVPEVSITLERGK
jgi:hypothetical protein